VIKQSSKIIDACIVGFSKCGTTSLAAALAKHKQLTFSQKKETQYFWPKPLAYYGPADPSWIKDVPENDKEYAELFDCDDEKYTLKIEASGYIADHAALQNLYCANPEVKIILILRDPVERAVSAYRHLKRDGYESLDFTQALACEGKRIRMHWGPLYWYRGLSDYLPQIKLLLSLFKRNHVHFILFEKLLENPEKEIQMVEKFLGIEHGLVEMQHLHSGKSSKDTRLAKVALASLSLARGISRNILPRSISSFMGRRALYFSDKYLTEILQVEKKETEILRDLYNDAAEIEKLTGLPCEKYWDCER